MDNIIKYISDNYHKKKYIYDNNEYNFITILKKIYNIENLTEVCNNNKNTTICSFETDNKKIEILQFYKSSLFNDFILEYNKFIKNERRKVFLNEKFIVYQTKPTFRIHEKNNLSVGEWHRDSQIKYNHYKNCINFFLPFTRLNKTNTIWICNDINDNSPNDDNIEPVLINENEFASNYLECYLHGNKINISDETRISIDFRIIPGSLYNNVINNECNTTESNVKMKIGEYYSILYF